jgi:hypothetical protein
VLALTLMRMMPETAAKNSGIVREVSKCRVCGCSDLVKYLDHYRQMAKSLRDSLGLKEGDLVVDIAGNDGALLAVFKDERFCTRG